MICGRLDPVIPVVCPFSGRSTHAFQEEASLTVLDVVRHTSSRREQSLVVKKVLKMEKEERNGKREEWGGEEEGAEEEGRGRPVCGWEGGLNEEDQPT
ncbi:hypothetical protein M0804_012491 [Polistes exclamans]|nr:hypothetical protein M0804_012491 [Polistes exclamans]